MTPLCDAVPPPPLQEPELDYWPPSSPVSPVPLNLGLPSKLAAFAVAPGEQAPELVGADFFLWVEVRAGADSCAIGLRKEKDVPA